MRSKRLIAGISALMLMGSTAAGSVTAFAEQGEYGIYDAAEDLFMMMLNMSPSTYSYTVNDPENPPEKPAAEKFDLRDVDGKNYVTPVKDQGVLGTCWAFAATAAAETSLLYETGSDLNEALALGAEVPDLSERHLAWFAATPLPENGLYPSQAGEGMIHYGAAYLESTGGDLSKINNDKFGGGYCALGTTLYSSLQGPAYETMVPYLSNEYRMGTVKYVDVVKDPAEKEKYSLDDFVDYSNASVYEYNTYAEFVSCLGKEETLGLISNSGNDGWYKGPGRYWMNTLDKEKMWGMDWSVDESLRFVGFELENSNILPNPALSDPETGAYIFNEYSINAIKNELMSGRAVSISFLADTALAGQGTTVGGYMNYIDENGQRTDSKYDAKYWCHYTYDKTYDPQDPASVNKCMTNKANHAVCIVGYDDTIPKEYFNDPFGFIKDDGAFIVKNSWGTKDRYIQWGNDGDGYFYLSYYDQSLRSVESFDFNATSVQEAEEKPASALFPNLYDCMPAPMLMHTEGDDAAMANIFEARLDLRLKGIGIMNATCNETVKCYIFKLNENATSPEDGELVATVSDTYPLAGYHRVNLDQPLYFPKGTRYSIVVNNICENGKDSICVKAGMSKVYAEELAEEQRQEYIKKKGTDEGFYPEEIIYTNGVINKGESFVCVGGFWFDWAEIINEAMSYPNMEFNYFSVDNFTIQAFTETEVANVQNTITDPAEPYYAGDEVACNVAVKNLINYAAEYDVYINGQLVGNTGLIDPAKTVDVPYTYTVTDSDAEQGYFETTVSLKLKDAELPDRPVDIFDDFSTPTVKAEVGKKSVTPEPEPEPEPEVTPTPEDPPAPDDGSSSGNPDTGMAAGSLAIAAIAVLAVAEARKRN
ncbi:MAG: hypothetical protein IKP95_05585 [Ruminococcus sp.]|nr:hypothetical protein [Ruminococcus sp.]